MSEDTHWRIVALGLAAATLIASVGLFYLDKNIGGAALATAFVVSLIFVFLARFKKFKGLGIEAELWEEKFQQATQLTNQLSRLRLLLTAELVSLSIRVGRWGPSYSWIERIRNRDQLRSIFEGDPTAEQLLVNIDREIGAYIALDYFSQFSKHFLENVRRCWGADAEAIRKKHGSPIKDAAAYAAERKIWREKGACLEIEKPKELADRFLLGARWASLFEKAHTMYGDAVLNGIGTIEEYRQVIEMLQNFESQKYRDDDLTLRIAKLLEKSDC